MMRQNEGIRFSLWGMTLAAGMLLAACGGDSSSGVNDDKESSSSVASSSSIWSSSSFTEIESSSSSMPAISYGEITDSRDKQKYKTVVIGTQTWMAQNLNYAVDSSWCYDNSADSCAKYGRLYQWAAAMGLAPEYNDILWGGSDANHQGVCPAGWHIPTNTEWLTLFYYANLHNNDEDLEASLTMATSWEDYWEGDNESSDLFGFSALAAGMRYADGSFDYAGWGTGFWSSTEAGAAADSVWGLGDEYGNKYNQKRDKAASQSIRCLRDSSAQGSVDTPSRTETSAPTYGTMTDKRDGQTYYTVVIGTQTWMAENLNYAVDSSWCYENKTENCTAYGRLYQWAAAMKLAPEYNDILWGLSDADHQGVCSAGWHMPNDAEWQTLFDFVDAYNGDEGVGRSLKSTVGWETGKFISVGTNRFGFSALPVGQRFELDGELFDSPYEASFWSSSQPTGRYSYAYQWVLGNSLGDGDTFYRDDEVRIVAISVRCLKND